MKNNYYVYGYFRSKGSKNGNAFMPYYIGVGYNDQRFSRQYMVGMPTNEEMNIILYKGFTRTEAFEHQKLLIKHFGRLDLGTGCLRNTSGGGFTSGKNLSKEISKKLWSKKIVKSAKMVV